MPLHQIAALVAFAIGIAGLARVLWLWVGKDLKAATYEGVREFKRRRYLRRRMADLRSNAPF